MTISTIVGKRSTRSRQSSDVPAAPARAASVAMTPVVSRFVPQLGWIARSCCPARMRRRASAVAWATSSLLTSP